MRRLIYVVVILICVLIGVSFATLNADNVRIDFFLGVRDIPLSLLLVVTLLLGAVLGALASLGWALRTRVELGRLRRLSTGER